MSSPPFENRGIVNAGASGFIGNALARRLQSVAWDIDLVGRRPRQAALGRRPNDAPKASVEFELSWTRKMGLTRVP